MNWNLSVLLIYIWKFLKFDWVFGNGEQFLRAKKVQRSEMDLFGYQWLLYHCFCNAVSLLENTFRAIECGFFINFHMIHFDKRFLFDKWLKWEICREILRLSILVELLLLIILQRFIEFRMRITTKNIIRLN